MTTNKHEREQIQAVGRAVISVTWLIATFTIGEFLSLAVGDLAVFAAGMVFMVIIMPDNCK